MGKSNPILIHTEHDHPVSPSTAPEFLRHLQLGALLALRERDILNDHQLRMALERLGYSA